VALVVIAALALGIVLQLLLVSGLQHSAAQKRAYDKFRKELAEGTAPVGQTVSPDSNRLLALGSPVAIIKIPSIGVNRETVLEGTTSSVLTSGPGHSRSSPMPGQAGISVIFGRQASYGGPFSRIGELRRGQQIFVTTGEGVSTYKVIDVRHAGQLAPPALAVGQGRLLLETGAGIHFLPSGVLRVDADLVTKTLAGGPTALPATAVLHSEQLMANDTSTLWALVLWLQALVLVAIGAVWSWYRWGRQQTWIAFFPLIALVGLFATDQFMKILPNLL
jgi:sortase (surface protein transpeptidase)